MIILPIKKEWFDMILSGEKKEEYREIKPYYATRFKNACAGLFTEGTLDEWLLTPIKFHFPVRFRNGYTPGSPSFIADVELHRGCGKLEWGAEPGKEYYVLHIKHIHLMSDE